MLDQSQTMQEHHQELVAHYTRIIEVDPDNVDSYLRRAEYYDFLNDTEQVLANLNKYVDILNPSEETNSQNRLPLHLLSCLWRTTPTNLGPTINSQYGDGVPSISTDGLELYFNSDRSGNYDIWVTRRATKGDTWEEPVKLGPTVNTSHRDGSPSISANGLSLYFASDRHGGHGRWDIWVTTRETKADYWSIPINIGPSVNTSDEDRGPSVSADGRTLYFCSNRTGSSGPYDLWATSRITTNDPWGEPVNLGPAINSPAVDASPSISPDGLSLFFMSSRPGGYGNWDAWVATRATTDSDWGTPLNLGPKINTPAFDGTVTLSADGSTLYFMSGRPGGVGHFDLWQISITPISGSLQKNIDVEEGAFRNKN
jgi:Tol biopolymer transport system component